MELPRAGASRALKHGRILSGRGRPWLLGVLLASVVAAPAAVRSGSTEAQWALPDDVEAAYLYNFAKFVRWPEAGGRETLLICVAGSRSFAQTLTRLTSGESIDGRAMAVKFLPQKPKLQDCSILFISTAQRGQVDELLRAVAGRPVLTVSDSPDFLERGGVIQFLLIQSHVRFSVNLTAANRHGLDLSSELLKVATSVAGKTSSGAAR